MFVLALFYKCLQYAHYIKMWLWRCNMITANICRLSSLFQFHSLNGRCSGQMTRKGTVQQLPGLTALHFIICTAFTLTLMWWSYKFADMFFTVIYTIWHICQIIIRHYLFNIRLLPILSPWPRDIPFSFDKPKIYGIWGLINNEQVQLATKDIFITGSSFYKYSKSF